MGPSKAEERSALKLAQCRLLISEKSYEEKKIELILEKADLNMVVPNPSYLENCDSEFIGCTFLHLAYLKKNIDAFNFLIHKGADFSIKDQSGFSVLHKSFQLALEYTAGLKKLYDKILVDACNLQYSFIESVLSAHLKYKDVSNPSDPDGVTHFHIACATNNVQAVEFFLSNGVPVDEAANSNKFAGYTALHFAVESSCLKVVGILLNHGANLKLKNAKGKTPLDVCIEINLTLVDTAGILLLTFTVGLPKSRELNEEVMKLLLNHNDREFSRLCAVSCIMQNSNLNDNLLSQVDNINQSISMDSQNWPGYTLLHFAAHVNVHTVKLLMNHEADIQARDVHGMTPFNLCVERYEANDIADIIRLVPKWKNIVLSDGKTKLIDLLLAYKDSNEMSNFLEKSIEKIRLFVPFDSPLWPGFTLLHVAVLLTERKNCKSDYKPKEEYLAFNPDLTVITEILKRGADVTIKDHRNWTPVHFAFRLNKKKILDLLLQHHHSLENPIDDENLSHLHIACKAENSDLVKKLLSNGADANIAYKGKSFVSSVGPGSTPLHVAVCEYQDGEILKSLLKFGADPHQTDNYGFTPIHNIMGDLIPHNRSKILFSSSNFRNCECKSFVEFNYLHVAAWTMNVDAVRRLLDLGVDVNAVITYRDTELRYFDVKTPLHCALIHTAAHARKEQSEVVGLLIERGADILIKNPEGTSSLEMMLDSDVRCHFGIVKATLGNNHELRRRVEAETGITLLHIACWNFDVDLLVNTLNYGVDVDKKVHEDSNVWPGYSALHVLIRRLYDFAANGERDDVFKMIVKILLGRRADVALLNAYGRTPLQMAFYRFCDESDDSRMTETLSLMLKAHKNFEINPTDAAGISHFHIACHMLNVDVVKNFLEQNVNVNLTIDVFHNFEIAAKSPLLLTLRKINSSNATELMTKSFAQLKIVDMLIKRGACVDVEDLCGNAPVHYAVSSCMKENLLQRLADAGADVNARNVRGEAPLELLMKQDNLTLDKLRLFITCGCHLNAFNSVTDEGYISLAEANLSAEDLQRLVFGTFVNFPEAMARDNLHRTALHNIVSSKFTEIDDTLFPDLLDICSTFGYDIDDQDNLGRTPLHLAALFRNCSGIRCLILAGADLNKVDNNGKTPFAYLFDSCCQCYVADVEDHNQFDHEHFFEVFASHVQKLQALGLELNVLNDNLLKETLRRFNDVENYNEGFSSAVEKMAELKIEPYSLTVKDFMSDTIAVVDYPTMSQAKRQIIDEFFHTNKSRIQKEFAAAAGVFQLQYRKAIKRCGIIDKAKDSLAILTNLRSPDLSLHKILNFLRNSDLENVIAASFQT